MKFRYKAFGLHLMGSAIVLTFVPGGLYLGWYRWPGWYLCNALDIVGILLLVDLTLGPLLTLLIANPKKSRRELVRDVGIIVCVQVAALIYGAATLWNGRPLYYTFSEDRLQLVQASDLKTDEIERAQKENPPLAPRWYSLPRWVWAPLPDAAGERRSIVVSALTGGGDVIEMPRYFKPWQDGLTALRAQLKTIDAQRDPRLHRAAKLLRGKMQQRGLAADEPVTLIMTGQGSPLLAVFDRDTLKLRSLLRSDR
jgi:hypothetical protein